MKLNLSPPLIFVSALFAACALGGAVAVASAAEGDHIPITTSSPQARLQYVEARDLLDKSRRTEAHGLFTAAVANDPGFALAWLGLAKSTMDGREVFKARDKAVDLAPAVSEGERHMILGFAAWTRGNIAVQEEHYRELARVFPNDGRAVALYGDFYFGLSEWERAAGEYLKAVRVEPDYPKSYNRLGYCYRALERYDEAEKKFTKYIDLLPGEANPYDSMAELLMKMGRFDESIEYYTKAIAIDSGFVASYVGLGNDYIFLGRGDDARRVFTQLNRIAVNAGRKRQALYWMAVSWIYDGEIDKAIEAAEERADLSRKADDDFNLSEDLIYVGDIYYEDGRPAEASEKYAAAVEAIEKKDVPELVREAVRVNHAYEQARIALLRGDVTKARAMAQAYRTHAEARNSSDELCRSQELAGMIAAYDRNFHDAVHLFEKADRRDPRVLFLSALALKGNGQIEEADELFSRVARYNGITGSLAFVKGKAEAMLAVAAEDPE